MNLKSVIKELDIQMSDSNLKFIHSRTSEIMKSIKDSLKKQKIKADVFLGGSFAKGTVLKGNNYDVDLFVRFSSEPDKQLTKVMKSAKIKYKMEKVHGSRDYYRIEGDNGESYEVIPVLKIKNPKEAVNVTDLSYFHVDYVNKKLSKNKKLIKEVLAMKKFCKANNVYGAESYINGFSGYAVECLIIYYGSFEKLAKAFIKAKEKIIIDQEKQYKNKNEILFELNESKLKGPVVLVDPTWKDRNVLAALSQESFDKFNIAVRKLISRPNKSYFDLNERPFSLKDKSNEILIIKIETDRQEGDIAGTKLKKFSRFIKEEISKYFEVKGDKFEYDGLVCANYYLELKSKGEIIKKGPPVNMKKEAEKFKLKNKDYFIKDNIIYSKIKVDFSPKEFIIKFYKKNKEQIKDMDIVRIEAN